MNDEAIELDQRAGLPQSPETYLGTRHRVSDRWGRDRMGQT